MKRKIITTMIMLALSFSCTLNAKSSKKVSEGVAVKPINYQELLGLFNSKDPSPLGLSEDEKREVICFAYQASAFEKAAPTWSASAKFLKLVHFHSNSFSAKFLKQIPSKNFFVVRRGGPKGIWQETDQANNWQELLRLVNFPESADKEYPNASKIYVFIDQPPPGIKSSKLTGLGKIIISFIWPKICQLETVTDRKIDSFQPGDDFLDSWIDPTNKQHGSKRSVAELNARIAGLSRTLTKIKFLTDSDNLSKVYRCTKERVSEAETAECAERLWNYEFDSLFTFVTASIKVMGKSDYDNSKPKYLPPDLEPFFRIHSGEKATKNYLRFKMMYLYKNEESPDYDATDPKKKAQFARYATYWEKHK